jgi:hypothetical protein
MQYEIYTLIYLLRGAILKSMIGKPLPAAVGPLVLKLKKELEKQ